MKHVKTALYRHFDKDGVLLYVGISLTPLGRLREHRQRAPWAEQIVNVTIEWHPNRQAALDAELAAIQAEKPRHNIDWNGPMVRYEQTPADAARLAASRPARKRKHPERTTEDLRAAIGKIGLRNGTAPDPEPSAE